MDAINTMSLPPYLGKVRVKARVSVRVRVRVRVKVGVRNRSTQCLYYHAFSVSDGITTATVVRERTPEKYDIGAYVGWLRPSNINDSQ
jgi:hypothetical protein